MSEYIFNDEIVDNDNLPEDIKPYSDGRPIYKVIGELIRCKDCKSYQPRYSEGNEMLGRCENLNSNLVTGRGYCYWAERREK